MREPDITVRGTRHRNIEAALEHLPVSDEEVDRLREAGGP